MGRLEEVRDQLAAKFAVLFPRLDERQRRLLMGAEAQILGHGGIRTVARAAGKSETTVRKGMDELEAGDAPLGRVRRSGGGRKKIAEVDPGLRSALLALVEPDVRGDQTIGKVSKPALEVWSRLSYSLVVADGSAGGRSERGDRGGDQHGPGAGHDGQRL